MAVQVESGHWIIDADQVQDRHPIVDDERHVESHTSTESAPGKVIGDPNPHRWRSRPCPMALQVDQDRLWADLDENANFGSVEADQGRGRTVLTGTQANRRARDRFVDRLHDAGCSVAIDAVGNIRGRWVPDGVDPSGAPVASGSHLDSVPRGGMFDGPLGTYGALEALRSIQDANVSIGRPIDVVCFTEEEGSRFGHGLLGSAVATGEITADGARQYTDESGRTLGDALSEIGYAGSDTIDASAWDSWVELHVEQSRRLAQADVPVGIVSDITGIAHVDVTISGDADHAGATPMVERSDALTAASEVILDVEDATGQVQSDTAVGTVGSIDVTPNTTNVIPGEVRLGVDIRDVDRPAMDAMLKALRQSLDRVARDRPVATSLSVDMNLDPTQMAVECRMASRSAADAAELGAPDLHSGAAHDSMHVASVTDAGMLFAQSRDGRSHSPQEWTSPEHCAAATTVLAGTVQRLAAD
jgi:N-carbamoyl-L-amino-acid hydrolase